MHMRILSSRPALLATGALLSVLAGGPAFGQSISGSDAEAGPIQAGFLGKRKSCCPVCPPVYVTPHVAPAPTEPQPSEPSMPEEPTEPMPETTPISDMLAADVTTAPASQTVAPNMFGDQFGSIGGAAVPQLTAFSVTESLIANSSFNTGGATVPAGRLGAVVLQNGPDPFFLLQTPEGPLMVGDVLPLDPEQPFINLRAGAIPINGSFQNADFIEAGEGTPVLLQSGSAVVTELQDSPGVLAFADVTGDFVTDVVLVAAPNPAGGGVVGRLKISEDNNPLPRDRFIFGYDHFNNVPLTPGGWNVDRFSPGFEKTFFDRAASFELRFPFASTLNSEFAQGAEGTDTEFGNIRLLLKALMISGDALNVATGLGISFPTASDTRVALANGSDLVRIENEAVLLSPYIAALFTPNDRLFSQVWAAADFDVNGNPVSVNPGPGLLGAGDLNAATLMQLDGQIGYWIMRSDEGLVRGLAPFIELHYNTTLGDPDVVNQGLFIVGDLDGNVDELNLSAGVVTQVGDNLNVSVGGVAPLKRDSDRRFDAQFGVRANWYFGPTARARRGAFAPPTF